MAAPSDDDRQFSSDLYARLQVSKEATPEEINNAFRRLSKIYHPDKHSIDPQRKEQAEMMFNKIKYSHEVLMDPHKRAIYDTLGLKAIETDGWEVVPRTKTPSEIREEYERLAQEREERRLNQRTNPRGNINIGIDATDVFDRYEADDYGSMFPTVEIRNMSIAQSVECPLTSKDTATLGGSLHTQNGTGGGSMSAAVRRIISEKSWAELEVSGGSGPAVHLKGFRTLHKRMFGTMAGMLQFTPHGLRPSLQSMVAVTLDKNFQGRLTWNVGHPSSMNTSVVWENPSHRAVCAVQLGVPSSFISCSYSKKFLEEDARLKVALKFGTFGAIVEYGGEKKITQFSVLGASLVIGVPTGVLLKIKLNRGNQSFMVPIHLSEEISPSAILYGTIVPLAAFYIIKKLIITPILDQEKERDIERKKEMNAEIIRERRKEAEAARELMKETTDRIRTTEEQKKGLVVVKAIYGKLVSSDSSDIDDSQCIDVTDPIQACVNGSKLVLPAEQSKSGLPGFYDPCLGEEKVLYIRYKFREQLHHVTIGDMEEIRCPLARHVMTNGSVS
ncbi:dnaJ homolog subfamily C member 11-like [Lineus longissimus]|uniref:dnaJ homolog subfamily C member 11-like n=1 Tax=Lineus longissimus TaxID=88925 RepID=UPI002B4F85D2